MLTPHPVADLFPMMSADEYAALRDDIELRGQHEPIWTMGGQILDGRNRYRACCDIGLAPATREYSGPSDTAALVAFVVSLNLKRRHLTESQKATVGVKIKEQFQAVNPAGRPRNDAGNGGNISTISEAKNRDMAGQIVGVSGRYIDEAERIQEQAPDLFMAVQTGEITIPDAKREIRGREKKADTARRAAEPAPELPPDCTIDHADTTAGVRLNSVDFILTDPPYNISAYAGVTKVGDQLFNTNFDRDDDWDSIAPEEFIEQLYTWCEEWERVLRPGGAVVAFTDRALISHLWDALRKVDLRPKNIIVWAKTNPSPASLARRNLISATEFMVWAVKPGASYTFNETDLWDRRNLIVTPIIGGHEKVDHPTQKPLSVLRPLIATFSEPGDLVLDPFAGSGGIGVAALEAGRRAHLIERDIDYVRLARERVTLLQRRAA